MKMNPYFRMPSSFIASLTIVLPLLCSSCQTDPIHAKNEAVQQAYREGKISSSKLNEWNRLYVRETQKMALAQEIGLFPTDSLYEKWVGWGRDTTKVKRFLVEKEPRLGAVYFPPEPRQPPSQGNLSYTGSAASFTGSSIGSDSSTASYSSSGLSYGGSVSSYAGSQSPYSGSTPSYASSQASQTGSRTSYESSTASYGQSRASYLSSNASYQTSRAQETGSRSSDEISRADYSGSSPSYTSSRSLSPDSAPGVGARIPGAEIPWNYAQAHIDNHDRIQKSYGPVIDWIWKTGEKKLGDWVIDGATGGAYDIYKKGVLGEKLLNWQ